MFGNFRVVRSTNTTQSTRATLVPVELLQHLKMNYPLPVTISGTNNIIWTLNASVTEPLFLWNGDDFVKLTETRAVTWKGTAINVIASSSGVISTAGASAAGVWYAYLRQSGSAIVFSQTGPGFVEGKYNVGYLGHPGTARTEHLAYIGWQVVTTATTPVCRAMTKRGYTYWGAATSKATTTTWAELDFSARIPKLGALGGQVVGYLETGADGGVYVGQGSSSTVGVIRMEAPASGTTVSVTAFSGYFRMPMTADGKVYARDTTARGDVHIIGVEDVI